ncbi:MAG: hypothetical protein WAT79_03095 [Saprospiraceae bacterium]
MLLVRWMVLCSVFVISCKSNTEKPKVHASLISKLEATIQSAENTHKLLLMRSDSLKPVMPFESLKIKNSLEIAEENLASLKLYRDSLSITPELIQNVDNCVLMAETQNSYVASLTAAGKALLDNRSFSFGKWVGGDTEGAKDSIPKMK